MAIRLKPRHAQTSAWRVVGTNAVAKVLVMAASGVLAFITTRLIIQHFGIAKFAIACERQVGVRFKNSDNWKIK